MESTKLMTENLTQAEAILLSAKDIGSDEFCLEKLIVQCHKNYPYMFGLHGYEQHPDSNRVSSCCADKTGPVLKGWLVRTAPKTYKISNLGLHVISKFGVPDNSDKDNCLYENKKGLDRGQSGIIQDWFLSNAWKKWKNGGKKEIDYSDACQFWKDGNRSDIMRSLVDIEQIMGDRDSIPTFRSECFRAEDLRLLRHLNEYLSEIFGKRYDHM